MFATSNLSKAGANHPAHVIVERRGRVKGVHAAVAGRVAHVAVVADPARRVAPGQDRVALAVETSVRAEGGILVELLGAVAGGDLEHKVVVADVAAGRVGGLKGEASAVAKTGADFPAGLLLEGGGARGGHDLAVDSGARVCEVVVCVAGGRGPERDGGADGQGGAAGQRSSGVLGSHNVGLNRVLGGIGRVSSGHNTLVESALGPDTVVTTNTKNDGTLLRHRVVAGSTGACAVVVGRQ